MTRMMCSTCERLDAGRKGMEGVVIVVQERSVGDRLTLRLEEDEG